MRILNHTAVIAGSLWRAFLEVSAILTLVTLVRFGMCIRGVLAGSDMTLTGKGKYLKYTGYSIATALVCLNLAMCGLVLAAYFWRRYSESYSGQYIAIMTDGDRILFAYSLILMLLALGVVVWAALMKFRKKNKASTTEKSKVSKTYSGCKEKQRFFCLETAELVLTDGRLRRTFLFAACFSSSKPPIHLGPLPHLRT